MKRGIAAEPHPPKGHQKAHASTTPAGESGGRGAAEPPAKPRSKTVATFLRPHPQLPPEHASDPYHRASLTGVRTSLNEARVQDRRNAFLDQSRGAVPADLRPICVGNRGLTSSASLSSWSTGASGDSLSAWQREGSFSAARKPGSSCRRLSATDPRGTGAAYHQGCNGTSDAPREAPNPAVLRGPSSTGGVASSRTPSLEAFATHSASHAVTSELHPSKDSDHPSRTPSASGRHNRSFQELSASRRDPSATGGRQKERARPVSAVATGKVNEAESIKVGFTVQTARERMVAPSSYLLSATRTRESLLVPGEGRAYHLGVQHGELHNRILTVGHAGRADWLAERFLDPQMRTLSLKSNRNFRLHTGYYRRKPVSIVAVGMGAPMMDVLVREASYITDGPLAIIRLGTCTLLDQELRPGSIVVASQGSLGCYTNYAYFDGTAAEYSRTQELKPYTITRPCAADPELSRLIYRHAAAQAPDSVFEGLNASAETFYSCQAREDLLFRDENEDLLETLLRCGAQTMEMETHQLLHLASRRIELMKAAAVHIGVTSRTNDHFMHPITVSIGLPNVQLVVREARASTKSAALHEQLSSSWAARSFR
ncbi:hypothetical protein Efla_005770 [Eimeria flavescens]